MILGVRRDDSADLRDHVERYHYLRRYPDPRSLPFGYALEIEGQRHAPDGRMCGLVVMKKPQHHRQARLFGYEGLPTAWQVLDLARVWINPFFQETTFGWTNRRGDQAVHTLNIFSQMVGLVLRRVQSDWLVHHPPVYPDLPYHIRLIISYCEQSHHDGKAYRACNFERFGVTSDGSKELYIKRLRQPQKSWKPTGTVQMPLLP